MSRRRKLSPEQALELRRAFAEVPSGKRSRFYWTQSLQLGVSVSTIQRNVLGMVTDTSTSHRVKFTPELWARWLARRDQDEHTLRLRKGIQQFRAMLASKRDATCL